jgi:anti-anti-sigma regulatory factor
MSDVELFEGVNAGEFHADARKENGRIELSLRGTADLRAQESLDAFLKRADACARAEHTAEVVVDVRSLDFMNSSCFKAFVSWIGRLQALGSEAQYRIRFVSDQRMLWQRRSLHALACFAVDLVSVEGE